MNTIGLRFPKVVLFLSACAVILLACKEEDTEKLSYEGEFNGTVVLTSKYAPDDAAKVSLIVDKNKIKISPVPIKTIAESFNGVIPELQETVNANPVQAEKNYHPVAIQTLTTENNKIMADIATDNISLFLGNVQIEMVQSGEMTYDPSKQTMTLSLEMTSIKVNDKKVSASAVLEITAEK